MTDKRDILDNPGPGASRADLIAVLKRAIELDLRVSAPGEIVAYNPTTQTATIQLTQLPVTYDASGEEDLAEPVLLPNVPVAWLGGSQGYVTTPLVAGDSGHVVFSDRALDVWMRLGSTDDPVNSRTHDLADGVFYPGVRPNTKAITPPPSSVATTVEGPPVAGVKLGATATDQLTLAQSLHTYLVGLIAAGVPLPTDGGTNLKSTMAAYLGANPFTAFATIKTVAE